MARLLGGVGGQDDECGASCVASGGETSQLHYVHAARLGHGQVDDHDIDAVIAADPFQRFITVRGQDG